MTLLAEALAIAATGWPVFPCGRNKKPCIPAPKDDEAPTELNRLGFGHGFHDASTDPDTIQLLFTAPGSRLLATPTGEASGVDVLDIDYRNNGGAWEESNRHRLPETRTHRTLNGGRHYLFRHAPGVRNSAAVLADGVDIRGDGGYICVPPVGYSIESDVEIAEWPDWLLATVLARNITQEAPRRVNGHASAPLSSARFEGLTRHILGRVLAASLGGKHFALRNAALQLGGLMDQAGLSEADALERLLQALPASEVKNWENARATALWGLRQGRLRPLEIEDRPHHTNGKTYGIFRSAHTAATTAPGTGGFPADIGEKPSDFSDVHGPTTNEPTPDTFPLQMFREIKPHTDVSDFVENLLISASMIVVYGESGSGKTFFAINLALQVAAGGEWNGRGVDQGGVIYIAMEGSHGINQRVAAWREHHGLDNYDLPFAALSASLNLLDPAAHLDKLIRTTLALAATLKVPLRLVVVDTLSRAMAGGNENAPDDMGALVTNGTAIQEATGVALMWIHHCGKDAARGARGHSLLRGATDTEIEVSVDGSQHLARVTKQREIECIGEFFFQLRVVELGTNRRGKPVTSCIVEYGDPTLGEDVAAASRRLTGHAKRAFEILANLCAEIGQSGHPGTPSGALSVPEDWWRERFYSGAMPGEKDDTKLKAFSRATKQLINQHLAAMAAKRVWLVSQYDKKEPNVSTYEEC